jgi:hypothetical protein
LIDRNEDRRLANRRSREVVAIREPVSCEWTVGTPFEDHRPRVQARRCAGERPRSNHEVGAPGVEPEDLDPHRLEAAPPLVEVTEYGDPAGGRR